MGAPLRFSDMGTVALWLVLTLSGLLLIALLLWRYSIARLQARRRRQGRQLFDYLQHR